MNDNITRFLREQTCVTICCVDEAASPYCFSCYYVFNQEHGVFYFKSSTEAHHSELLTKNPSIAGTVLPDKLNILATKGIQWRGEVLQPFHPLAERASMNYHKKYPMAAGIKGELFTVRLTDIKMTVRSFGFGKKISWKRNE